MSRVERREFVVAEGEAGWRLDAWLAAALGASRAEVRRELARGGVSLDGRVLDLRAKGHPVVAGDRIAIRSYAPPAERTPVPDPAAPLVMLGRGGGWVAVDKPAGMPVHPFEPDERGTVLNALVARIPEIAGVGEGGLRSGVVHRLDVGTSGVLLFATDETGFQALRSAFRKHRVHKTYRALVAGDLRGGGELVLHLAVARHRPARVRVVEEGDPEFQRRSRRTLLRWRSLQSLSGASLVEIQPVTGFLHQIRASLAHLGHPVLGDASYGAPEKPSAGRPLLHAARVAWGRIDVFAPDPPDFSRCLARLSPADRTHLG